MRKLSHNGIRVYRKAAAHFYQDISRRDLNRRGGPGSELSAPG